MCTKSAYDDLNGFCTDAKSHANLLRWKAQELQGRLVDLARNSNSVRRDLGVVNCFHFRWYGFHDGRTTVGDDDRSVVDERTVSGDIEHLSSHHVQSSGGVGRTAWIAKIGDGIHESRLVRITAKSVTV